MSDENQNEDAQVVEETVEDAAPKVDLEATAKKVKAKSVKHRVLFTSPFGRKGDIVTVDPSDSRVVRLVGNGGLEKV